MVQPSYANLPQEFLGGYWAAASLELVPYTDREGVTTYKRDKRPRHPVTGVPLSVAHPQGGSDELGNVYPAWCTFAEAAACGAPAIGKLLLVDDGYTVLDLDDMSEDDRVPEHLRASYWQYQERLLDQAFPLTYTEVSVSGKGLHAIYKASLRAGRRASRESEMVGAELYGHGRFMICTGNAWRNLPIAHAQGQVQRVADAIAAQDGTEEFIEAELPGAALSPDQLKFKLAGAKNGHKFISLYEKGYNSPHADPDRSTTDSQFAQMMAWYQPSFAAFLEVWRTSALWRVDSLGKVDKHGYSTEAVYVRNYITRTWEFTVGRAIANRQHEAQAREDAAKLAARVLESMSPKAAPQVPAEAVPAEAHDTNQMAIRNPVHGEYDSLSRPPGLMGEIADYLYATSARPNKDISAAAAITFFAALAGRVTRTAHGSTLTQYTILLAKSGYGKNDILKGLNRLVDATKHSNPGSVLPFLMGPGNIASGQGLRKALAEQPSMFTMLTEFSADWQRINHPMANSADRDFKRVLLEAYDSPKLGAMAYSDKDKNVDPVDAPNFCFIGDTTTDDFLSALDMNSVGEGLAPRMTIVCCTQDRPPFNKHAGCSPTTELTTRLEGWAAHALRQRLDGDKYARVPLAPDAQAVINKLAAWEDQTYNSDTDGMAPIWARVTHKAIRYATLAAVSCDRGEVELEHAEWGIRMAKATTQWLVSQFKKGGVGSSTDTLLPKVLAAISKVSDPTARGRKDVVSFFDGLLPGEVPRSFITAMLKDQRAFRHMPNRTSVVNQLLDEAQSDGWVERLTADEMKERGMAANKKAVYRLLRAVH